MQQHVAAAESVPAQQADNLAQPVIIERRPGAMMLQASSNCAGSTDKVNATLNVHLATGRIGKVGTPFSLTGQPNAMGGRGRRSIQYAGRAYGD